MSLNEPRVGPVELVVDLPIQGIDGGVSPLVDAGVLAEEAGWDGVSIEDYVSYYREGPLVDPWLVLAAIASRTERIRLDITVSPLARRRPWKVAREAVTLDHLSGGRFTLGVGVGDDTDKSFTHFGEVTEPRSRAGRLDETLEILDGLWSGRPFAYQGEHFRLDEVTFQPRPVQRPRIPIWVGGGWPREGPLRRAARWDGAVFYKATTDGTFQPMEPQDIAAIRTAIDARRTTKRPYDVVTGGPTHGKDPAAARAKLAPLAEAGLTVWHEFLPSDPRAMRRRIEAGPPPWD
jgi:alkanesulfonate monooxygenase SsuD/methylene tetrahydromethanopterin reductase-like flavin-dependent oxidoreductase (luciferase family)